MPNSSRTEISNPSRLVDDTPEFQFATPYEAIDEWRNQVAPLEQTEQVPLAKANGRVLAHDVQADRESPPCTVTAMDGYVLRLSDLKAGRIDVAGEVLMGQAPPALPKGCALQIFTGAPIPTDGDVVVKREDTVEHPGYFLITDERVATYKIGKHLRYQGENLATGTTVVRQGTLIDFPTVATLAGFGNAVVNVFKKLRLTILATGDELRSVEDTDVQPWEIRNSNGPALGTFFDSIPWIDVIANEHMQDHPQVIQDRIVQAMQESDAVILSGGVSMGDHDYVPNAVQQAGGKVVFHKLPVRPGKPMFAAIGPQGQVIAGLPGNPVSVMVGARRTTIPVLAQRAGIANWGEPIAMVHLDRPLDKSLHLWWYRQVQQVETGVVQLIASKGSGDFASAAGSIGFIEIEPGATHVGPWPFWSWSV